MVVKDRVGRTRYILVRVPSPGLHRGSLIHHVVRNFNTHVRNRNISNEIKPPWLTVFDNNYAIFKCPHVAQKTLVAFLDGLPLPPGYSNEIPGVGEHMRVLKVSGTIKKLKVKIKNYENIRGVRSE